MVDANKANADIIRRTDVKESEISVERWRPIDYLSGYYDVSDMGRVRSLQRGMGIVRETPLVLRVVSTGDNMGTVAPSVNNVRYRVNIGREVWRAFVGEIPDDCHIGRIDKNRFNNRLSNLVVESSREMSRRQNTTLKECCKMGVGRHNGKYRVRATIGDKNRQFGEYKTEREASIAMEDIERRIDNNLPLFDDLDGELWASCDSKTQASNMGRVRRVVDAENGLYRLINGDSVRRADGTTCTRSMAVWDAHGDRPRGTMSVHRVFASKGHGIDNLRLVQDPSSYADDVIRMRSDGIGCHKTANILGINKKTVLSIIRENGHRLEPEMRL